MATSAFLFSELIAQKDKRERAGGAGREQDPHVLDEIRESHEGQAAQHHFPKLHSLAVDEGDETNRAENKTTDQIPEVELEHVDLGSYTRASRGGSAAPRAMLSLRGCAATI